MTVEMIGLTVCLWIVLCTDDARVKVPSFEKVTFFLQYEILVVNLTANDVTGVHTAPSTFLHSQLKFFDYFCV